MTIRGRVYVLGDNIDTDQIIPAEYLNLVPTIPEEYRKLGSYALAGLARTPDQPPFVPPDGMTTPYTVIVAGKNFGCGSSREHAAWGLEDAGFRVVIAPSFGDIFRANSVKNGMAAIELGEAALAELKAAVSDTNELTVDLEARTVGGFSFELDDFTRECLLQGLDEIALTLREADAIDAYEAAHAR